MDTGVLVLGIVIPTFGVIYCGILATSADEDELEGGEL
jgi:hypothetical protein